MRLKGVVSSFHNLEHQAQAICQEWEMTESDIMLHSLRLDQVHGMLNGLLVSLFAGAACEMVPPDPHKIWKQVVREENCPSVLLGSPTTYERMLQTFSESSPLQRAAMVAGVKRLRLCVSGQTMMPGDLQGKWESVFGVHIRQRYPSFLLQGH
eukprot:CAMPEP_0114544568 /NCGR_PEP_ID=MMETSP0114-20121206/2945_1 /TAXON_ID=31324 /ORGANISM="Goniomonas sp, Strain m" /LENGTH=152 /DNA_ID=CAMNT_0001728955 /DNA_START=129 /DNA_END=587 /DNA_ORIENTATION=-